MITLPEIIEQDKRPPSVTVYMSCYNHEKYIDQAIQSVLMQKTNFPVNIVIHDDASPDSSAEIIRRYASENPNITAIIEESNCLLHGKTFFQNIIPYFTGKYIAYCECDDYWIDENKLQIQVDYLENNPDCVGVYSNSYTINKFGLYTDKCWIKPTQEGDYPSNYDTTNGVLHQLASCVHRNFWQFMTPDEINYCINLKGVGDNKILTICINLGRVHHFKQSFSAYRFIYDEGDSYSARFKRLPKFEQLILSIQWKTEIYIMIEHFWEKKYYKLYLIILWDELLSRIKYHRSLIKEAHLPPLFQLKNIPWFMYAAFPFYAGYRVARKIFRVLTGKNKK